MDYRIAYTLATARQDDLLADAAAVRIRGARRSRFGGVRAALDELRTVSGGSYLDLPGVRRYPY
ncbi:MAG: hypothetical protein M3295_10310 [Chloroflexota bacterium]|nr:hypothetical protein [Chloroflexota bacterium]